jgi:hypothetical protein
MSTVRVKIDAPAGLVELEGDRETVREYLDKLLPLIESAGFGTVSRSENGIGGEPSDPAEAEQSAAAANGAAAAPPKKKRRVAKRPPAGSSCRERILILRRDGFFKEHRSSNDIVVGLGKKGWTHTSNQVGASLSTMFSNAEIQRTKEGGSFTYYWDRH